MLLSRRRGPQLGRLSLRSRDSNRQRAATSNPCQLPGPRIRFPRWWPFLVLDDVIGDARWRRTFPAQASIRRLSGDLFGTAAERFGVGLGARVDDRVIRGLNAALQIGWQE